MGDNVAPPPTFSDLQVFVSTLEFVLENLMPQDQIELFNRLTPNGSVRALNTNFGHKAQPAFAADLKNPETRKSRPRLRPRIGDDQAPNQNIDPATRRVRKVQGDGTCFNSAIEVAIDLTELAPDHHPPLDTRCATKSYKVKTFPINGITQIPGTICQSFEDGICIAHIWAQYLTRSGVALDRQKPIVAANIHPIMINSKFHIIQSVAGRNTLVRLSELLNVLEREKTLNPPTRPYPMREIKTPQNSHNVSFKFVTSANHRIRINIFHSGKINILGAKTLDSGARIYEYITGLIRAHSHLVVLEPLPDTA